MSSVCAGELSLPASTLLPTLLSTLSMATLSAEPTLRFAAVEARTVLR